jgi:hypothetical protein
MSNKGLSKHTLSNFSKKKPKLPRYVEQSYEEHTLLTYRVIRHTKYDNRNGYKLITKFLESKLSCDWDKVYSELKAKLKDYPGGRWQWNVNTYVELHAFELEDKWVSYSWRGKLSELSPGDLYVDNEKILQQIPKIKESIVVTNPKVIVIGDLTYRYIESRCDIYNIYQRYRFKKFPCWAVVYEKEVKKPKYKLATNEQGIPIFYNKKNCRDIDLLYRPMLVTEYEEIIEREYYPVNTIDKLKLANQGVPI